MKMEKLIKLDKNFDVYGFSSGKIINRAVFINNRCIGQLRKKSRLPENAGEITVFVCRDKAGKLIIKADRFERPSQKEYALICSLCSKYNLRKPVYDTRAYEVFKIQLQRALVRKNAEIQT